MFGDPARGPRPPWQRGRRRVARAGPPTPRGKASADEGARKRWGAPQCARADARTRNCDVTGDAGRGDPWYERSRRIAELFRACITGKLHFHGRGRHEEAWGRCVSKANLSRCAILQEMLLACSVRRLRSTSPPNRPRATRLRPTLIKHAAGVVPERARERLASCVPLCECSRGGALSADSGTSPPSQHGCPSSHHGTTIWSKTALPHPRSGAARCPAPA